MNAFTRIRPLLVIVGPTAVGKTEVSIHLAEKFGGEIVSADSMQVYRGMDIGTAKPSLEQRRRIPHHLIDIKEPWEPFSVSEYQQLANQAIQDILSRSRLPIMVGGSGLYINAVVYGYTLANVAPDKRFRMGLLERAEKEGTWPLYQKLTQLDPDAAKRIHPHDKRRIIRALEFHHKARLPISQVQRTAEHSRPYSDLILGLTMERSLLYQRINKRVDDMIQKGLVEEVASVAKRIRERTGWPDKVHQQFEKHVQGEQFTSLQALGYKEILVYLEGKCSLQDAIETLKRNTRRFAKRQLTWLRRDSRIYWFDVGKYRNCEELMEVLSRKIAGEWPDLWNRSSIR